MRFVSGIQVNAIGPGYFETELTRPLVEDEQFDAWVRRRTPAARWGKPKELVGALLFLASPASDFVNGQILYVDGGVSSEWRRQAARASGRTVASLRGRPAVLHHLRRRRYRVRVNDDTGNPRILEEFGEVGRED